MGGDVIQTVHIEPANDRRGMFAAWCLTQTPPLQTSSASGWDVPTELYPDVPVEALEGAHVDGWPVGGVTVPAKAAQASHNAVDAAQDVAEGVPSAAPIRSVPSRATTARKAPARKPRKRTASAPDGKVPE